MTREEAITWCDRFNDAWANADPEDDFPDLKYSDTLDQLFYLAGQALRQQECVGDANKALTLDEMRKMDGEPVWVVLSGMHRGWYLVSADCEAVFKKNAGCTFDEIIRNGAAYLQKPEES